MSLSEYVVKGHKGRVGMLILRREVGGSPSRGGGEGKRGTVERILDSSDRVHRVLASDGVRRE